jgi:hypothetical protein
MKRPLSVLVLVLCIIVSFVCVASAMAASDKVFSLPEENGNIIVPANASYVESGVTYFYENYTGLQIHVWYVPMFTTGNGTTNIYGSAHDCNLTVNSYKQATLPMEAKYMYNVSSSVDCTVAGGGVAHLEVSPLDGSDLSVYFNGALRQEGDGWNMTSGYLSIQGPANVTITSSEADYWPPRNAPHDELFPYDWILAVAVTVAIIVVIAVLAYRHYRRKAV